MKISIRASKHQAEALTIEQLKFANECVITYLTNNNDSYFIYSGQIGDTEMDCDVYKTKTQISAIVRFQQI